MKKVIWILLLLLFLSFKNDEKEFLISSTEFKKALNALIENGFVSMRRDTLYLNISTDNTYIDLSFKEIVYKDKTIIVEHISVIKEPCLVMQYFPAQIDLERVKKPKEQIGFTFIIKNGGRIDRNGTFIFYYNPFAERFMFNYINALWVSD